MDIKPPTPFHQVPEPPPASFSTGGPAGGGDNLVAQLLRRFKESRLFPVFSIAVVLVIILGIGFAVVGLVGRLGGFGGKEPLLKGAPESQNITYPVGGAAELKLSVISANYQPTYNEAKPLAEGRKFAVLVIEIRNDGDATAPPLMRDDVRLIAPDGSILPSSSFSEGFLNIGIGGKEKRRGEIVWDIDPRNNTHPLSEFQIAFGRNPGSRALYPVTHETK